jgi:hypothetical protein
MMFRSFSCFALLLPTFTARFFYTTTKNVLSIGNVYQVGCKAVRLLSSYREKKTRIDNENLSFDPYHSAYS